MEELDESDALVFFLIANTTPAMTPPSMRPATMTTTAKTLSHKSGSSTNKWNNLLSIFSDMTWADPMHHIFVVSRYASRRTPLVGGQTTTMRLLY
jgi:hypothetical protein